MDTGLVTVVVIVAVTLVVLAFILHFVPIGLWITAIW